MATPDGRSLDVYLAGRRTGAIGETGYRLPMIDWPPTDDDIEGMVIDALEALPAPFRYQLGSVAIVIDDEATRDQLNGRAFRFVRLYQGVPGPGCQPTAPTPSKITIFRGPLVRATATPRTAGRRRRRHGLPEIAHHFGISDPRIHELQEARRALAPGRPRRPVAAPRPDGPGGVRSLPPPIGSPPRACRRCVTRGR